MNRSWYTKTPGEKSPDTIHQILVFGSLDEIRELMSTIGARKIKELFLRYPKKIYTQAALNFIKNFILHINDSINEQKYLKSTPRSIR